MFQLSRFQLSLIFLSLLILRVVVGFHFFKEGTTKLKDGFTAKPFFAAAKGPLAPYFKGFLDDPDGRVKLCLSSAQNSRLANDEGSPPQLDPEFTYLIWDDFIDQATNYFGLGSPDLIKIISERRLDVEKKLAALEVDANGSERADLQTALSADIRSLQQIAAQPLSAEEIFQTHKELLADFLDANRTSLVSHFGASNRLVGFAKDGDSRQQVAMFVDSLRDQVSTIEADRKKNLTQWSSEVVAIWDSLEQQINDLAVDKQAELPRIQMHRPFDQENSALKTIDAVIPWFDTIVGVLLILGLFSRIASGAAAIFLISVIATQPPLVPGAAPTYFYFIEMAACLVIFATVAGRFGGLDFFFTRRPKPVVASE